MARPFSYHILTPAMLPGWSLFYVHTCIPSLSPLNHNNSSTSKNQWMILVLFFLLVVSGLYFKKTPYPPGVFTKKTSKKLIPFLQKHQPRRCRNDARNGTCLDSCFCAAFRFGPLDRRFESIKPQDGKWGYPVYPGVFFEDHETKLVNLV